MEALIAFVIFVCLPVYIVFIAPTGWKPGSTPAERAERREKMAADLAANKAREAKIRTDWVAKHGTPYPESPHFGKKVGEAIGGAVVLGTAAAAYEAWKHRRRS